jgi:carboxypeptidase Taq
MNSAGESMRCPDPLAMAARSIITDACPDNNTTLMTPRDAYDELLRRSRERSLLASCLELLSWDELTHMPRGGVAHRGRQMAHMAGLLHASSTDARLGELLQTVEESDLAGDPHAVAGVNVRRWRWSFDRLSRVPRTLIEELADVATVAQQAWTEAREHDEFGEFLPWLERVIGLKRSEAECLAADGELYDALLQDYEPGATGARLQELFEALRAELKSLLDAAASRGRRRKPAFLRREFAVDRQRILTEGVAAAIGFDFERGRIDTTTHPFFSPIGPGDCRITTRYSATDFGEAFFSMLHELGHGLYEQGLDPEHAGTPMGEAPSLGLHESQSRLWENGVGRSRAFWQCFYPRVRELFHDTLHDVELDEFYAAVNHVEPGLNRVRADQVTYDLHVMVRFDLERALVSGDLSAAALPDAWRETYREYLGVAPTGDAEGCLQDGHWSAGQFGYFPTYTLGNIYAAQLLEAARRDLTGLNDAIAEGEFGPLRSWLKDRVYAEGQRQTAVELVERITGRAPDCAALVSDLQQKAEELAAMRPKGRRGRRSG